jgi:hypothetical protein
VAPGSAAALLDASTRRQQHCRHLGPHRNGDVKRASQSRCKPVGAMHAGQNIYRTTKHIQLTGPTPSNTQVSSIPNQMRYSCRVHAWAWLRLHYPILERRPVQRRQCSGCPGVGGGAFTHPVSSVQQSIVHARLMRCAPTAAGRFPGAVNTLQAGVGCSGHAPGGATLERCHEMKGVVPTLGAHAWTTAIKNLVAGQLAGTACRCNLDHHPLLPAQPLSRAPRLHRCDGPRLPASSSKVQGMHTMKQGGRNRTRSGAEEPDITARDQMLNVGPISNHQMPSSGPAAALHGAAPYLNSCMMQHSMRCASDPPTPAHPRPESSIWCSI